MQHNPSLWQLGVSLYLRAVLLDSLSASVTVCVRISYALLKPAAAQPTVQTQQAHTHTLRHTPSRNS